jgi:heme oxygenase (biliverdin-IX-beta and delta-forming)
MRKPTLDVLRSATGSYHDRLESGLALLDPGLSPTRYRSVLERFWGYCVPADQAIAKGGTWRALGLDGGVRVRAPRLRADLRHLGHDDASLAALPECPRLPSLDSPARGAGYLYVFEGATLGGAIITRHLGRLLGHTPERGAAFFGSYGARIGVRWKEFTRALCAYAERSGSDQEIASAAVETFSTLEAWLLGART